MGRIDANVVVAARRRARRRAGHARRCRRAPPGPSLRELLVGSEGALGVLTEVTLRVRPAPAATRYEGWFAHSFGEGADALRRLAQAGLSPDVARLSDEDETRLSLAVAGAPQARGRAARRARLRRRVPDDLRLGGAAGGDRAPALARRADPALGRRGLRRAPAGRDLAQAPLRRPAPARRHARPRRAGRDARDRDTWSRLDGAAPRGPGGAARLARRAARQLPHLAPLPDRRLALLHRDGAPGRRPGRQWRAAKAAASDAIAAAGATITHHHAIGRDHAPWLGAEAGTLGLDVLRTVKERAGPRLGDEPRGAAPGGGAGAQRGAPALADAPSRTPCRPRPGSAARLSLVIEVNPVAIFAVVGLPVSAL